MKLSSSPSRPSSLLVGLLCYVYLHFHPQWQNSFVTTASVAGGVSNALKSIDYRYFIAGGTCAAFSHGITTPIDVVKTRIQSDSKVRRRPAVVW
jgi:hypothetical protein